MDLLIGDLKRDIWLKNFDFYFRANMGWAGSYDGFYLVNKDMSISFEAGGYELNTGFNMICDIIL